MQEHTPTLIVIHEDRQPVRVSLRAEVTLGRDPTCTVPIDDGYLSRRHCCVVARGEQVVVRDLGSYNGTFVNGQRIHEECFVLPGDVLKVGRTRMFVDFGDEESQNASLRIFAPKLEHKAGVKPISRDKIPQIAPAYASAVGPPPPPPPPAAPLPPQSLVGPDGPQTRKQPKLQVRPDDKTPMPPAPSIVESSAARRGNTQAASRGGSSGGSNVSREREGMRVIAQISRVLGSAQDVHDVLDYALSRILEVIPAERGLIMRLDPARRGLFAECVKSAVPSRDDQAALRLGISHTIAKKVVRERVSVLVDDAVLDDRFKQASSVHDLQVRSILCVPLWLGEQVSGLIYLDHLLHAYAFSESDRDLLVAAANLCALGLERHAGRSAPQPPPG